jgi:hypothetical protein
MPGKLEILNVGDGHTEIVVDRSNPIELERASRIIEDMLKRGYALFVHGKGDVLTRVKRFDKKHKAYIVGAEATVPAEPLEPKNSPVVTMKRGKFKEASVPIESAKVTVVGRSAGG